MHENNYEIIIHGVYYPTYNEWHIEELIGMCLTCSQVVSEEVQYIAIIICSFSNLWPN